MHIHLTRRITVPDSLRVARFQRVPHLGPHILFFSGGTALKALSRHLIEFTHNSIHIMTPFDSGGSSAGLRSAFDMPAVGDIRNRLMALTDQSLLGNSAIQALFAHRLPIHDSPAALQQAFRDLMNGNMPLLADIANPMRKIIRHHLGYLYKRLPADFNLAGASIGNLVLAGGYLMYRRHLDPVIYIFSKLADVRGIVRPVVNSSLHLAAELTNGQVVTGQHRLTGKEMAPLPAPIKRLTLSASADGLTPARVTIRNKTKELIARAELICYPMGSFYSSVVANFLPSGVGQAIAANPCPKVFIPNTGHDPELQGHTLLQQVQCLLSCLQQDFSEPPDIQNLLNLIVLDSRAELYAGGIAHQALADLGLQIIQIPLVSVASAPLIDETRLAPVLLSLV